MSVQDLCYAVKQSCEEHFWKSKILLVSAYEINNMCMNYEQVTIYLSVEFPVLLQKIVWFGVYIDVDVYIFELFLVHSTKHVHLSCHSKAT